MNGETLGIGIVGCGNISGPYVADLATYPHVTLIGVADADEDRARALVDKAGAASYATVEALLNDSRIDLVVNLTTHDAHFAVTRMCLRGGKHVYSEKPLALTHEEAQALVDLARGNDLRLGCSPFTFLGEAQQTAWKWIREGRLGTVRLAYAEVNWGRIESWHPAPGPFYAVGALVDVGVYPLTLLTAIFGAARRVSAYGATLYPDRVTRTGVPFHIEAPDFVAAAIEIGDGPLVRLTTNFYVGQHSKQSGIEFHGDLGSLYLSSWQNFNAIVEFAPFGGHYEPVELVREPYHGTPWARGLAEMAEAILQHRPHRATGEHAAHIVEILCAAKTSMEQNTAVPIHSSITPPAPMEWAV